MLVWTIWFAGLLAIASVFMIRAAVPLLLTELRTADEGPAENRVLRLSAALLIHGIGTVGLILSPFAGWLGYELVSIYLFWLVLSLLLTGKLLVVHSISRLIRVCVLWLGAWTVVWLTGNLVWGHL